MFKKFLMPISILCILTLTQSAFANQDPLIGKWKTIDERTGYSLSDISIHQLKDGTYTATIIAIRAAPGMPLINTCSECTGNLKNKPLIGFSPLYGFKKINNNEFTKGVYLDPKTGRKYISHVRLSHNGKHLSMRNTLPNSTIGRNLIWVKY